MLVLCECGRSCNVPRFPFYCSCGKVFGASLTPTDESAFQLHWRKLHQFAFGPKWERGRDWYDQWKIGIPRYCNCGSHWEAAESDNPPSFDDRWTFFKWSVGEHNNVNQRIGKPVIGIDQAINDNLIFLNGRFVRNDDRPSVGFVATIAAAIGGTETWHKTLIPEVQKFANVTAWAINDIRAPQPKYDWPVVDRWRGCQSVVDQSDVAIVWGMALEPLRNGSTKIIAVDHGDLSSGWFMQFLGEQVRYADHIVAINAEVADHMRDKIDKPVTCIENAVSPARIVSTVDVRAKFDWLEGKRVVLWAARDSEEKQLKLAIAAAAYLPDDWILVVAGVDGISTGRVKYLGQLPSQGDWLAVASVFLSTAFWEGFGLSIGEAMLARVPVASTPRGLGSNNDLVTQFEVDAAPDRVAQAVLDAASGDKVDAAYRFISDNHSPEKIGQQWRDLIEAIL